MPLTLYLGSAISVDTSGVMKVDSKVTLPNAPVSGTDAANKQYVDDRITALIDSSPSELDTLREIVEAYKSADTSFNGMLTQLAANSTTALNNEISRAQSIETDISNNLASEVTRATSVETDISNNLASEVTRATSVETVLFGDLSTELSRAQSSELDLKTKLNETIVRLNTIVDNFYKTQYTSITQL